MCVSRGNSLSAIEPVYRFRPYSRTGLSSRFFIFCCCSHTVSQNSCAHDSARLFHLYRVTAITYAGQVLQSTARGKKKLELNATDAQVKTRVVEQRLGNSLVHSSNQPRDKSSDNEGASILADVDVYFTPDA